MPFFIVSLNNYLILSNYEETICNITRVEYPFQMPNNNNKDLWSSCDCGSKCKSKYPCIKLYSDLSPEILKKSLDMEESSCTFTETSCPKGEDPSFTVQSLGNSILLAESYINSSIACYVNKNNPVKNTIFLEYDYYLLQVILAGVTFSICILGVCIVSCISYCKYEKKCCYKIHNKIDSKLELKIDSDKNLEKEFVDNIVCKL